MNHQAEARADMRRMTDSQLAQGESGAHVEALAVFGVSALVHALLEIAAAIRDHTRQTR